MDCVCVVTSSHGLARQEMALALGARAYLETSVVLRIGVETVFQTAVREARDAVAGVRSVASFARALVRLLLLAQRFDRHSPLHRLPRELVVAIGRRVLIEALDVGQRERWTAAIAADGRRGKKCAMQ